MKKTLSLTIASTLAVSAVLPTLAMAQQAQNTQMSAVDSKAQAGITESERLALQMVIAGAMIEQKGGDLARVDREVAKKYANLRNTYFGSVPTSIVGTAFSAYVGPKAVQASATVAGPLLSSIQPLLQIAWEGLKSSGRAIDAVFTALKIDKLFEASSDGSTKLYNSSIKPVLQLLVNKNVAVVSGSSVSGALLYTSYKFATTEAEEAMSFEQLRSMLGQNEAIRTRIDSLVNGVAPIMSLDASAQAKLKILIYDSILSQAIANNFADDSSKYNLDIVQLMVDNKLVSDNMTGAVARIREVVSTIRVDSITKKSSNDVIIQNVDIALNLASAIESNINSGKIQDQKTLAELQRMLGALTAKLALIGFNFKK